MSLSSLSSGVARSPPLLAWSFSASVSSALADVLVLPSPLPLPVLCLPGLLPQRADSGLRERSEPRCAACFLGWGDCRCQDSWLRSCCESLVRRESVQSQVRATPGLDWVPRPSRSVLAQLALTSVARVIVKNSCGHFCLSRCSSHAFWSHVASCRRSQAPCP